jgi:3-oxoadipate enol-lactonase
MIALTAPISRVVATQEGTPTGSPPAGDTGATLHINGTDLFYAESGSGPPLLLIPGLSGNGLDFASLSPALEPHFRVIAMDIRGSGRSAAPPGPYTVQLMAEDAAGLLDHLGIDRAHVLGFSLGASIAQELAIGDPERVDHLVLLGGTARADPITFDPWLTLFLQAYERDLDPVGFQLWLLGWLLTPAFMTQLDLVAAALAGAADDPYRASAQGVAAQVAAARTHDTLDRLGKITAPTLVLVGAQDIVLPPAYSQTLAARIPGATLQMIDPGGHAVFAEYTAPTAEALLTFLTA